MSVLNEDFSCLFEDFGELATIEHTGEQISIVYDDASQYADLGLTRYENIVGLALISQSDQQKIKRHDSLIIESSNQKVRIELITKKSRHIYQLNLSEAKNHDYIHFTE